MTGLLHINTQNDLTLAIFLAKISLDSLMVIHIRETITFYANHGGNINKNSPSAYRLRVALCVLHFSTISHPRYLLYSSPPVLPEPGSIHLHFSACARLKTPPQNSCILISDLNFNTMTTPTGRYYRVLILPTGNNKRTIAGSFCIYRIYSHTIHVFR